LIVILIAVLAAMAAGTYFLAKEFYIEPKKERAELEKLDTQPPPEPPSKTAWRDLIKKLDPHNPYKNLELIRSYLNEHPDSEFRSDALDLLTTYGARLLFSPLPTPWKETYRVAAGDSLNKISTKHNVSPDWIMKVNNLLDFQLQLGQELLIPKPNLKLIASRSENRLFVLNGEELLLAYPLTLHQVPNQLRETKVREKMALANGERFAFGTPQYVDAEKIIPLEGTSISIRTLPEPTLAGNTPPLPAGLLLAQPDLEEVFLLVKRGTPVIIE
ncbi:MAG: LysM peptidoglycan-binding domain-containing protein, partial [Chthoniobacterales bacterium]|nr:LysM peptidoglycan-binding domain-containing protein [Chthoniobacterales bacterium]